MTMRYAVPALILGIFGSVWQSTAEAAVILLEDFDDATVTYTTSVPESSNGGFSYFARIGGTGGATVSPDVSFTNTSGGYFGIMNIADIVEMNFAPIDISNYTNLSFSSLFAEDDDGDTEDWDGTSYFFAEYDIDGNGFQPLFAIGPSGDEINGTTSGNTEPRVDGNFNGIGEGTAITDTFQQFTAAIAGIGNSLSLRFTFFGLDEAQEDLALDNVMVTGDLEVVPEPGSLALLGALAACSGAYQFRRRKKVSAAE